MAVAMVPGKIGKVYMPEDADLPAEERTLFYLAAQPHAYREMIEDKWLDPYREIMKKVREAQKAVARALAKAEEQEDETEKQLALAEAMELQGTTLQIDVPKEMVKDLLGENGSPKVLVGWENFPDEDGEPIPFNKDSFMDNLSMNARIFLTIKAFDRQFISDKDRKNSK